MLISASVSFWNESRLHTVAATEYQVGTRGYWVMLWKNEKGEGTEKESRNVGTCSHLLLVLLVSHGRSSPGSAYLRPAPSIASSGPRSSAYCCPLEYSTVASNSVVSDRLSYPTLHIHEPRGRSKAPCPPPARPNSPSCHPTSHPMIPRNPFQELRDLDRTSARFQDKLSSFIRGDVYRSALPGLQSENLTWLIECLDSVSLRLTFRRGC